MRISDWSSDVCSSDLVWLCRHQRPILSNPEKRRHRMADHEFCKVEKEGRITIVTLNRPDVMNALHWPAHFELEKVWDEFAADPEQWVAIVTGAGDRAFSAGNDRSEEHTSDLQSLLRTP